MFRRILEDETNRMDLEVGIWKEFVCTPPQEVEKPTYGVVGPVEQYDERDHVFSRMAMKEGSPAFGAYYERRPEKKRLMRNYGREPGRVARNCSRKMRSTNFCPFPVFYAPG